MFAVFTNIISTIFIESTWHTTRAHHFFIFFFSLGRPDVLTFLPIFQNPATKPHLYFDGSFAAQSGGESWVVKTKPWVRGCNSNSHFFFYATETCRFAAQDCQPTIRVCRSSHLPSQMTFAICCHHVPQFACIASISGAPSALD